MSVSANSLIDGLVEDLEPVRTLKPSSGLAVVGALTLFAVVVVAAILGVRSDLKTGISVVFMQDWEDNGVAEKVIETAERAFFVIDHVSGG